MGGVLALSKIWVAYWNISDQNVPTVQNYRPLDTGFDYTQHTAHWFQESTCKNLEKSM